MLNNQLLVTKTREVSRNSVRTELSYLLRRAALALLLTLMLVAPQKASASWDFTEDYAFDKLHYKYHEDLGALFISWNSILFDDLGEDEGFIDFSCALMFKLSLKGDDYKLLGYSWSNYEGTEAKISSNNNQIPNSTFDWFLNKGGVTVRKGKADCLECHYGAYIPCGLDLLNTRIGFKAEGRWRNLPAIGTWKSIWASKTGYIDLHHTFGIRPVEWNGDFSVDENGKIKMPIKKDLDGTYETDGEIYPGVCINGVVQSVQSGPLSFSFNMNSVGMNMRSKFTLDPCNVFKHDHDLDANGGTAYHTANAGARTFLPMPLATITSVEGNPDSSLVRLRWTADNENYLGQGNNRWVIYRDGKKIAVVPQGTLSYTDPGITPGTSPVYTIYYVHKGWSEDAKRSELKSNDLAALWKDKTGAIFISSEADWKSFALSVADGETFECQTVRLAQDIIVSTMVGTSDRKFKGTFDGGGHTLTFNLTTAEAYAAPFRYTEDATIRNLTVNGMIQTSQKFAAGIIAHNEGATTLEHCTSNIIINSTVNGEGSHGGLVAYNAPFCSMNITDCAFYGQLLGSSTTHCGGMVGYNDYGPVLIIRSEADWNAFAEKVRQGTNYAGQTILLAADIKVSKPIGNHIAEFAFNGIFEGNGHSVSINSNNSATGLFDNVSNATIRNLKVFGSISHCADKLGSVIGTASGEVAIQNCWSSVNVTHDASGSDSYVGALIGRVSRSAIVHIYDCLFTGSIKYNDRQKYKSDGMVGESRGSSYFWNCFFKPYNIRIRLCDNSSYNFARGYNNVTNCFYNDEAREPDWSLQGRYAFKDTEQEICDALGEGWEMKDNIACPKMKKLPENEKAGLITFTNCVFAPQQVTMSTTGSSTLCRNPQNSNGTGRSTFTGCTYTQAFGTAQGTKIGQETLNHSIEVDNAIEHGKVEVAATACPGDVVNLAITPDEGYSISTVTYNDGVEHTISWQDGSYTFVMPAEDVTVNATFKGVAINEDICHGTVKIASMCQRIGGEVVLDVTPDEGYFINAVTYNDGIEHVIPYQDEAYSFVMPNVNVTVSATFSSVTIDKDIKHGSVEIATMCKRAGEIFTLTVTPDAGYSISSVTYTDSVVHVIPCQDETYSFVMPALDVALNATFSAIEYSITYDLAEGRLRNDNPTSYTVESESFTLTNPVRQTMHFVGWTGTDFEDPTMDVTIPKGSIGDRTYTATWEGFYSGLSTDKSYRENEVGYLYVNMPKTGKKEVILRELKSLTFKLYDDGGKNGSYSDYADGSLTLTVPEGSQIQLSGTYNTEYWDPFQIYVGTEVADTPDKEYRGGARWNNAGWRASFPSLTYTTTNLTFRFSSNYSERYGGIDLTVKILPPYITLTSKSDNETVIHEAAAKEETTYAILKGRTLYRDGRWNTLCLPFNVDDFFETPLEGAEVRTLESVEDEDGTLAITFADVNSIEAGKPYIVKWPEGSAVSATPIENPMFADVKVQEAEKVIAVEGVNFVGCTSPVSIADTKAGQMVLLFDDADKQENLPSCHAYLTLPEGVKKVKVDFGDGASDAVITNHRLVEVVTLYDIVENHVDEHIGQTRNVLLASRTIDNEWNTLALPFDVTDVQLDETFGAGWALYEFSGSSLENGVLGLSFRKSENIEAGVPYFFRVSDDVKAVQEPVFHGVQMEVADEKPSTTAFVDFLPTLNITQIEGESIKEVLILGGGNTLYNPAVLPAWMRSYRGYFRVHDVNMDVAQFRMSFDIDDEVSGIVTVGQDSRQDCIYTLDGQQLKSQPTQRGFYITGNKKVMVK